MRRGEWRSRSAYRARRCRGRVEVQVQTTDDGIMLRLPDLGEPAPMSALVQVSRPDEAERRVIDEVGSTSLFGARFRMNAARALLLPRGNSAATDAALAAASQGARPARRRCGSFRRFPILVETYRDVLQDAFDMPALQRGAR